MIRCSYCKTENADSAKECKQCGKTLLHKKVCVNSFCKLDLSDLDEKMLFCPHCGEAIQKDVQLLKDKNSITIKVVDYSFEMLLVEAGTFVMGATSEQQFPQKEEYPLHKVVLPFNYYMAKHPVTIRLWNTVMGREKAKEGDPMEPVTLVAHDDCVAFCKELSRMTKQNFRIPTEAEWEYAARGGFYSNHTQYSGGDSLDDVGWFKDNSRNHIHKVNDAKLPNELGIEGLSGNVEEWCLDAYTYYPKSISVDLYSNLGNGWVARGGSYRSPWQDCRISRRAHYEKEQKTVGFRIIMALNNIDEIDEGNSTCINADCNKELSFFPNEICFCPYCGDLFRNSHKVSCEERDWEYARHCKKYKQYIEAHHTGSHVKEALHFLNIEKERIRKEALEEETFWNLKMNELDGADEYLKRYPCGKFYWEAYALKVTNEMKRKISWISYKSYEKESRLDDSLKWYEPLLIIITFSVYAVIMCLAYIFYVVNRKVFIPAIWKIDDIQDNYKNYKLIRNKKGFIGLCFWDESGFLNYRHFIILDVTHEYILPIDSDMFIVKKKNGLCGVYSTRQKKMIVNYKYSYIIPSPDGNKKLIAIHQGEKFDVDLHGYI